MPFAAGFNTNIKQLYSYSAGFTGTFLVTVERLHYASVNNAAPQQDGICTSLHTGQNTDRNVNCESGVITRLHTLLLEELCTAVKRFVTTLNSSIKC